MNLLAAIITVSTILASSGANGDQIKIIGAFGDTAWTGHPQTTVDKSYDGFYSTDLRNCYVTHNSQNAGAGYIIANSLVSEVRILNRADCCSQRLTGTAVSVCDLAETSCNSCGTASVTGAGQWAEVTCAAGAVGSIVKIMTPKNHFQACEVEVFGQDAQAVNSAAKIKINEAFGDFSWSGHQETIVDNSYDGSYSLDYRQCFITHASKMASARYEIANSKVYSVKLLNRFDCCSERLAGITVYVCDEAEVTCNQCGTAGVTGPGQWLTVPCRPATVGSIVKLVKPDSHLQLCEIEIFGVTAADSSLKVVKITGALGDAAWSGHPQTTVEKSYDGSDSVALDNCYVTQNSKNAAARYHIDSSTVSAVRLLNRFDCCSERLEGTQVFVCEDETETACKTCGTVDATGPGQWAVVVCLANAEGSLVKIIAPNTHLQICEVEVVGADRAITTTTSTTPTTTTTHTIVPPQVCEPQFADTTGRLEVASCESMEVKDDSRHCNNMFDGSLARIVKDGVCFVTKSNYKGWLEVTLAKTSVVNKIVMLSKGNGDGLAGTIVKVCTDHKKNCQRFGKVYKVNPDKCTILKGDGLSGNMVRFYIADSNLAICEMRIYGI